MKEAINHQKQAAQAANLQISIDCPICGQKVPPSCKHTQVLNG